MSHIGKKPIDIPEGVEVNVSDSNQVLVKGKLGELSQKFDSQLMIDKDEKMIKIAIPEDTKKLRELHGLTRALIANMIEGVSTGFTKELEINGVGYRAGVDGKDLVLSLGFSHPVRYPIPDGVTMKCERPTAISIHGGDKQKVGQLAAEIRAYRPPEPFKGKGIKYAGENIRRKEGKKK